MRSADLSRQVTLEDQRQIRMQTISGVVKAYYGAVLAADSLRTAAQALQSAQADLERAESVRTAGMSTDVDVLSIRVHLAAVTEQRIQRTEHDASATRPEVRESHLAADLAKAQADSARSALLPQVGFHAAFEADRQQFVNKGGANWLASIGLHWNLFNGNGDKARIDESKHWLERAHAEEQRIDSAVRLEVRRAWADLRAAGQRIEVAKAAVAEAEESLRITQNRYEAGMSNVTDLLRNETVVLESRTRYLAAVHDQRIAATMLELAAGRLSPDSEVLN